MHAHTRKCMCTHTNMSVHTHTHTHTHSDTRMYPIKQRWHLIKYQILIVITKIIDNVIIYIWGSTANIVRYCNY